MLQAADRAQARQAVLVECGEVVDKATPRAVRTYAIPGEIHTLLGLQQHDNTTQHSTAQHST